MCSISKLRLTRTATLIAFRSASYTPHQSDARCSAQSSPGCLVACRRPGSWVATESPFSAWSYDKIPTRLEEAYGMPNLAAESASGGLRGNIMRTPGTAPAKLRGEGLMNEAAASAGADPIQFRINHITDQRLIDILNATAKARGMGASSLAAPARAQNRQRFRDRPRPMHRPFATTPYWVGIAEIAVTPSTGAVQVTKFAIGVDCGKIINPRQLDRCMKSGVVMGLSEALKEEVTFDKSKVTSTNWTRYKILTMEERPRSRSSRSPAMIRLRRRLRRPLTRLALQQSLPLLRRHRRPRSPHPAHPRVRDDAAQSPA